jgi:hypothetical protein
MNGIRAGLLAVALGGTAIAGAAPAQAAVGFQLNFGGPGPGPGPGVHLRFGMPNYFDFCLTNSQIRRELRQNGYRNVDIIRENNRTDKVWAVGKKRGDWFLMRVDRCTGRVDRIREVDAPDRKGHFNFTFSF